MDIFNTDIFTWIILPILIFFARICDVSIGTLRIIFVSRGKKFIAPLLGFFEILIWIFAISQIIHNLSNVFCYIAYAGGFATGTFIGMVIEEKLAMGIILIRIITSKDATQLIKALKQTEYGVTNIKADGLFEKVHIIYTIIRRSDHKEVIEIIKKFNPKAFYTIEDIKHVHQGNFPFKDPFYNNKINLFKLRKKGK